MSKIVYLILFVIASAEIAYSQQVTPKNISIDPPPDEENLNVFQQWLKWNNQGSLLIQHLTKQAMDHYEIRDRKIAKLKTQEDWEKRQSEVKDKLMKIVGPFPERTPLKPRITGTIKGNGYRIDKIVFEAMPDYFVTGCLYIPDRIKGKVPAILNVIGHNQEAFRADLYQAINYNLARKGMIVFAIDPPGQGEHVQYYDPEIKFSSVGYTVVEHCYFGNQCFLNGTSAARYFIWEGIRAIDYLLTRKDVDPSRIGVTGFSGGGTVTSYISAFDDRVKVSIPSSWSTSNRKQLETKGVQDAEAVFLNGVSEGITFEDLIEVRAPKPTLLTFVSRDQYLSIQGSHDALSEASLAYKAFGFEENIKLSEDDSKHWMTPKIRQDIYSFFMKHFNISGDPAEEEAELFTIDELQVTPTGQISTSYGGDMVFDVNKKEAGILIDNLNNSRKDVEKHLSDVKVKAKVISGFIAPSGSVGEVLLNGRYQRDGYTVGKYTIMGEGDYPIPILLFIPDDEKNKHPALVYLHSEGKITEAAPGGDIEKLVKKGYIVAAADLIGVGETINKALWKLGDSYTSILIGRSIAGIQAGDIVRVVNYLKERGDTEHDKIGAIGINEMCIPLIHAAAFDNSIDNITLIGPLLSYRSVAMNRLFKIGMIPTGKGTGHPYDLDFNWGVAGALKAYDLPDLIGCIAPRKVAVTEFRDHTLEPADKDIVDIDMAFPRSAYSVRGVSGNLKIISPGEGKENLPEWGFE